MREQVMGARRDRRKFPKDPVGADLKSRLCCKL